MNILYGIAWGGLAVLFFFLRWVARKFSNKAVSVFLNVALFLMTLLAVASTQKYYLEGEYGLPFILAVGAIAWTVLYGMTEDLFGRARTKESNTSHQ